MQKTDTLEILEYSEPFHNSIPTHIQNPVLFIKIYEYSELWHKYSLTCRVTSRYVLYDKYSELCLLS